MRIMWVSPHGDGWGIAYRLRQAGHKVVLYNPKNKNGAGYLPQATDATWYDLAKKSDLLVCDGTPDSSHTRRSMEASDLVRALAQLKHDGVPYTGPLPTTELLENDPRYLAKHCARLAIRMPVATGATMPSLVRCTLTISPAGEIYMVWRYHHLWGNGNGPAIGNLADLVFRIRYDCELVKQLKGLTDFLRGIGFNGYLNVAVRLTEERLEVESIACRFLYPAIFCQFPDLLNSTEHLGSDSADGQHDTIRLAVSLLRFDEDSPAEAKGLTDQPGFFGCEMHLDPEAGERSHGRFVGAIVASGPTLGVVRDKIDRHLRSAIKGRPGWGYLLPSFHSISPDYEALQKWVS